MAGGVHIVSRRVIRPESESSTLQEPEIMHLTPWDLRLMTVEHIQKGILLPKPLAGGASLVHDLASSFARALDRFYPLAGRLTVAEVADGVAGDPGIVISLRCNGEGAEFVHAVALEVTVSDITASLYVPSVVCSFFPCNGIGHGRGPGLPPCSGGAGDRAQPIPEEKGMGWAAWLLNRAVVSFDETRVRDGLASWVEEPSFLYAEPPCGDEPTSKVATGSSPRFDVYGNDFGWGQPVAVRSGAGNKMDGKATVYQGRGGGGSMGLEVCLSHEALARLVADEKFMEAVSAE